MTSPLLALPLELRYEVYQQVVHPNSSSIALSRLRRKSSQSLSKRCPPILLVNKQINGEIVDWLLRLPAIMRTVDWETEDGIQQLDMMRHGPLLAKIRRLVIDVTALPQRPKHPIIRQLYRIWRRSCSLNCVQFYKEPGNSMNLEQGLPALSNLPDYCSQIVRQRLFHRLESFWAASNMDVRNVPAVTSVTWSSEIMAEFLHWAATYGHTELVAKLYELVISEGDMRIAVGPIVLMAAARNGHIPIMRTLLNHPVLRMIPSVQARVTLLCEAAQNGRAAMTRFLADQWEEVTNRADEDGMTALHHAAAEGHARVVSALLQNPHVLTDLTDEEGATPLHWALESRKRPAIRLLLCDSRTNVNAQDHAGSSPLICAAKLGMFSETRMLLADPRIDVELRDEDGRTALSHACEQGHLKIVRLLLTCRTVDAAGVDYCHRSPLSYAAALGHEPVVRLLLATCKVNPLAKDIFGVSPLRYLLLWQASPSVIRHMVGQVFGL